MPNPIRIGLVGLGKISQEQHLPSIEADPNFEFAFFADRQVQIDTQIPLYSSLQAAIDSGIPFDAVALCTSPQPRLELFELLSTTGCAVLLEKPAAATLKDANRILAIAQNQKICTMTAWHSQFAASIKAAKSWVSNHTLLSGMIEWRENAQMWHPGQQWLWQEGGYGVFDPGMNALSILTKLTDRHWRPYASKLYIPQNVKTPNRAKFALRNNATSIEVEFEFHDSSDDIWEIKLNATNGSELVLSQGGKHLEIDGKPMVDPDHSHSGEYPEIYSRFSELVRNNYSEIDLAPLEIIDGVFANANVTSTKSITI